MYDSFFYTYIYQKKSPNMWVNIYTIHGSYEYVNFEWFCLWYCGVLVRFPRPNGCLEKRDENVVVDVLLLTSWDTEEPSSAGVCRISESNSTWYKIMNDYDIWDPRMIKKALWCIYYTCNTPKIKASKNYSLRPNFEREIFGLGTIWAIKKHLGCWGCIGDEATHSLGVQRPLNK